MADGTARCDDVVRELRALASAALEEDDMDLVHAICPSYDPSLSTPLISSGSIPVELLSLVSRRGHAALLTRLLTLADAARPSSSAVPSRPAVLVPAPTPTPAPAVPPTKPAEIEKKLLKCVGAQLEVAILAGDRETIDAMVADYDQAVVGGHLSHPNLSTAVPGLVRVASQRHAVSTLEELFLAGAEGWACNVGDHHTLALLRNRSKLGEKSPPTMPIVHTLHTQLLGDACRASESALGAPAPSSAMVCGGARAAAALSAAASSSAIALAAERADVETLASLLGGEDGMARTVKRAAQEGDTEMLAVLFDTTSNLSGAQRLAGYRVSTAVSDAATDMDNAASPLAAARRLLADAPKGGKVRGEPLAAADGSLDDAIVRMQLALGGPSLSKPPLPLARDGIDGAPAVDDDLASIRRRLREMGVLSSDMTWAVPASAHGPLAAVEDILGPLSPSSARVRGSSAVTQSHRRGSTDYSRNGHAGYESYIGDIHGSDHRDYRGFGLAGDGSEDEAGVVRESMDEPLRELHDAMQHLHRDGSHGAGASSCGSSRHSSPLRSPYYAAPLRSSRYASPISSPSRYAAAASPGRPSSAPQSLRASPYRAGLSAYNDAPHQVNFVRATHTQALDRSGYPSSTRARGTVAGWQLRQSSMETERLEATWQGTARVRPSSPSSPHQVDRRREGSAGYVLAASRTGREPFCTERDTEVRTAQLTERDISVAETQAAWRELLLQRAGLLAEPPASCVDSTAAASQPLNRGGNRSHPTSRPASADGWRGGQSAMAAAGGGGGGGGSGGGGEWVKQGRGQAALDRARGAERERARVSERRGESAMRAANVDGDALANRGEQSARADRLAAVARERAERAAARTADGADSPAIWTQSQRAREDERQLWLAGGQPPPMPGRAPTLGSAPGSVPATVGADEARAADFAVRAAEAARWSAAEQAHKQEERRAARIVGVMAPEVGAPSVGAGTPAAPEDIARAPNSATVGIRSARQQGRYAPAGIEELAEGSVSLAAPTQSRHADPISLLELRACDARRHALDRSLEHLVSQMPLDGHLVGNRGTEAAAGPRDGRTGAACATGGGAASTDSKASGAMEAGSRPLHARHEVTAKVGQRPVVVPSVRSGVIFKQGAGGTQTHARPTHPPRGGPHVRALAEVGLQPNANRPSLSVVGSNGQGASKSARTAHSHSSDAQASVDRSYSASVSDGAVAASANLRATQAAARRRAAAVRPSSGAQYKYTTRPEHHGVAQAASDFPDRRGIFR